MGRQAADRCAARLSLGLFLLLALCMPPAWSATLVGYWNLDEGTGTTAADSSGSGNTGTLINSPQWTTGEAGNALNFISGSKSYVAASGAGSLANLFTHGMTVTAWIKPATAGDGGRGRIVDKDNNNGGWFLSMYGANMVRFAVDEFPTVQPSRNSAAVVTLNSWQHIAATWDGSVSGANIHIYVNGVLADGVTTDGAGVAAPDDSTPFAIGNRSLDAARGFAGSIDEVRVYDGVLSAAEIQALVNPQVPGAPGALTAMRASDSQVDLSWTASSDSSGVTGYLVERCAGVSCSGFAQIASPSTTTYVDSGLTAATSYSYRVRAVDAANNLSPYSTVATAPPLTADTQAPTVPTGLNATNVTTSAVTLGWTPSTDLPNPGGSGVAGYFIYRNGNSTPIATVTSGTSFTDSGLASATTYVYRVAAFDAAPVANVSAQSAPLSVTTQSVTTSPFTGTNIGAATPTGSYSVNGGTSTVAGSGVDIWGSADSFEFVSETFTGDGTITARVVSQTNTNAWAKAGVMFRETLAAGSAFAATAVSATQGSVIEARTATGALAVSVHGPVVKAPYWVRMVRAGSTLTGYVSADGNNWAAVGNYTVPMAAQIYAGLAVTSHSNGTLSTAVFDNVSVSPAAAPQLSVAPGIATLTLGGSQQFTATVADGSPVTWSVDGVTGGNDAVGAISQTGLYTAGSAAGQHAIVATSSVHAMQSASAVAAVTDLAGVYTYHNNLSRNGANTQEYALTTANVNTAHFGKLAACTVDGTIQGQPLWVANLMINGARHNVVLVATQHDGLFAFDADASPCSMLWSANLLDSGHGGSGTETPVPYTLLGFGDGDIRPELGVSSTPVIDPSTGILYVVSKSVNSAHTAFFQRLHAIDVRTGLESPNSPVTISATYPGTGAGGSTVSFDARQEHQRAGLALVNGVVYIAWAAHEDFPPWYGWMVAYQYDGTGFTQKAVINTAPNKQEAGIWMSGGAPAADSNSRLYVITGNGQFNAGSATAPNNDYGDSLLQLTPGLTVSQWFTPSNQLTDSQNDQDFGSGGAAILADLPAGNTITHALICGGKDHSLFVLNRDLLGGFGDGAAVQKLDFGYRIFATGAFWNNNFYLAGHGGPLQAYRLNTATAQFSKATASSHTYNFPGATPSVSSSATTNGIVWSLDNGQFCTLDAKGCGPAVLYAHDATNVSTELWNSSKVPSDAAGHAVKFSVPTIANGKVYVGTRGNNAGGLANSTSIPGELDIYGLKP